MPESGFMYYSFKLTGTFVSRAGKRSTREWSFIGPVYEAASHKRRPLFVRRPTLPIGFSHRTDDDFLFYDKCRDLDEYSCHSAVLSNLSKGRITRIDERTCFANFAQSHEKCPRAEQKAHSPTLTGGIAGISCLSWWTLSWELPKTGDGLCGWPWMLLVCNLHHQAL